MPVVREQLIQKSIIEYLKVRQIFAWRNNTGAMKTKKGFVRFGLKGSADILGILPNGRFLAIEVKTPGGEQTREQREFLYQIGKNGGVAILARSLEQVMSELEGKI